MLIFIHVKYCRSELAYFLRSVLLLCQAETQQLSGVFVCLGVFFALSVKAVKVEGI